MPFSERELAIMSHLARRASTNRQIARDLGITEAALKVHLTRLFKNALASEQLATPSCIGARDNGVGRLNSSVPICES